MRFTASPRRWLTLALLGVLGAALVCPASAADEPAAPPAPAGPAEAVERFLAGMDRIEHRRGEVEAAWAEVASTLDSGDLSSDEVRRGAEALHQVIRRVGLPEAGLPDAEAVAAAEQQRYVLFPRPADHNWVWQALAERGVADWPRGEIALEADDAGGWRFTSQTLGRAAPLAAALAPLPPMRVAEPAPPEGVVDVAAEALGWLGPTFERTPWWGWVGLFVAIFLGLLAGRLFQLGLRRAAQRLNQRGQPMRATVFDDLASPLSLALLTLGITLGLLLIHIEEGPVQRFVHDVLALLYILALAWFLYNLVDMVEVAMRRLTRKRTAGALDDTVIPLLRKTLRIFLVVVFALVVAQNIFGLNITGWLAGLGIAGLAVSLAAQDSVRNLFGSLMIYFDKPFGIGDWIIFDGYEGYVEEIGFRSTRLRLWARHQVTVPNMKFNDHSVTNVGRRPLDRRIMNITIPYDTPPAKVREAVDILHEIFREPEVAEPFDFEQYPPRIAFNEFNDASLNIQVFYYYMLDAAKGRGYWEFFQHRQLVNLRIFERFNEAGIEFAFPTQTLHLAGDPKRELALKLLDRDGDTPPAPAR